MRIGFDGNGKASGEAELDFEDVNAAERAVREFDKVGKSRFSF